MFLRLPTRTAWERPTLVVAGQRFTGDGAKKPDFSGDFRAFGLYSSGCFTPKGGTSDARFPTDHLETGGHVTFEIGDKVIYPNHGLGVVQRIESRTIMGMTCGFYQLRMVSNETTVLVPVENADSVGLRKTVGNSEVDRLYSLLGDGKIDTGQNWKGRFKDNSDRMRTGSLYDVVEVLKSLTFLRRAKSLSFREKRMLDRAKFLVASESRRYAGGIPRARSQGRRGARALFVVEESHHRASGRGEGREGPSGALRPPARRRRWSCRVSAAPRAPS